MSPLLLNDAARPVVPDAGQPQPALPTGKFGAIVADPPWPFRVRSDKGKGRSAERYYPTMSLDAIKAFPVGALAAEDCALFLWAIAPLLPQAFDVVRAWGFQYKSLAFAWVKTTNDATRYTTGMGYWTRSNVELALLATRGRPRRLNADVRQIISAPRREHSRKPDELAARVERLVPGPYVELFARQRRPRWVAWGDQLPDEVIDAAGRVAPQTKTPADLIRGSQVPGAPKPPSSPVQLSILDLL